MSEVSEVSEVCGVNNWNYCNAKMSRAREVERDGEMEREMERKRDGAR